MIGIEILLAIMLYGLICAGFGCMFGYACGVDRCARDARRRAEARREEAGRRTLEEMKRRKRPVEDDAPDLSTRAWREKFARTVPRNNWPYKLDRGAYAAASAAVGARLREIEKENASEHASRAR